MALGDPDGPIGEQSDALIASAIFREAIRGNESFFAFYQRPPDANVMSECAVNGEQ